MAILAIIAVIALGGYACGFIKARELSALRKEMKLYVDRMEAAELDLHAIRSVAEHRLHGAGKQFADLYSRIGLAPIFPYTFYHLTHYWFAAADIPVANDTPVHYADAIRCNVRRPPQGSLPLLTRRVSA